MGIIARKMGIKEGARALLVRAPEEAVRAIDPPPLVVGTDTTLARDYIHVFVRSQAELDAVFPQLKPRLAARGALWVSWPKGRQLGADLALKDVIRIGYDHGLVESKCLSIDATWSALKFTHPVIGNVYNNSYGQLHR